MSSVRGFDNKDRLLFHCIFPVRYKYQILNGKIVKCIHEALEQICEEFNAKVLHMVARKDHLYIVISTKKEIPPNELVNKFYSFSSDILFDRYPHLKRRYWDHQVWADNYLCTSECDSTKKLINSYLARQLKTAK